MPAERTATAPHYPTSLPERARFKCSGFQWRLYDLVRQIPEGKVTTYGALSEALTSSPRAVGSALRNNPFAPTVPCHRIVAANGFIGGFGGDWASKASRVPGAPNKTIHKREILEGEGVHFDDKGVLVNKQGSMWQPPLESKKAKAS